MEGEGGYYIIFTYIQGVSIVCSLTTACAVESYLVFKCNKHWYLITFAVIQHLPFTAHILHT